MLSDKYSSTHRRLGFVTKLGNVSVTCLQVIIAHVIKKYNTNSGELFL